MQAGTESFLKGAARNVAEKAHEKNKELQYASSNVESVLRQCSTAMATKEELRLSTELVQSTVAAMADRVSQLDRRIDQARARIAEHRTVHGIGLGPDDNTLVSAAASWRSSARTAPSTRRTGGRRGRRGEVRARLGRLARDEAKAGCRSRGGFGGRQGQRRQHHRRRGPRQHHAADAHPVALGDVSGGALSAAAPLGGELRLELEEERKRRRCSGRTRRAAA